MNPYLFTVTFLLLMSLITSTEAVRFTQSSLENSCYLSARSALLEAEELRENSHLEELRNKKPEKENEEEEETEDEVSPPKPKPANTKKTSGKRIARLRINTARPPNNSRLNLFALLHKEPSAKFPEEFSHYETFARLMRSLYGHEPFFIEVPNAEYRILDKIIEKKDETASFKFPDELCTLSLEDPQLQKVFFQMLKGTKKSHSLLNFITFDTITGQEQARKINFLFADPLILEAIFPEERTVEKLLTCREKIWAEILDQEEHRLERAKDKCLGRRKWSEVIQAALKEVLISEGLNSKAYTTQVFDYGLGEPGTIIFVEDPLTKELKREKYLPPVR